MLVWTTEEESYDSKDKFTSFSLNLKINIKINFTSFCFFFIFKGKHSRKLWLSHYKKQINSVYLLWLKKVREQGDLNDYHHFLQKF